MGANPSRPRATHRTARQAPAAHEVPVSYAVATDWAQRKRQLHDARQRPVSDVGASPITANGTGSCTRTLSRWLWNASRLRGQRDLRSHDRAIGSEALPCAVDAKR